MHESLQMYTFLERKFREKYNGDINFLPKSLIFEKITKNMFFAIFLSKQATKKIEILKMLWNCFIDLKHPFRCCVFSFLRFFADFLSFMPNKVKNLKIL